MKSIYLYIFSAFICILFYSCKNNLGDEIGTSIQPSEDIIIVNGSSFDLSTYSSPVERIYNNPDSFLLGRFENEIYGPLSAEILTQFNVPFDPSTPSYDRFPESNSETESVTNQVDSIKLVLYYSTWFGSEATPINLTVYRMNGSSTLDFNTTYPSDMNIDSYVNINSETLLGEKTFTAKDMLGERDSTYISVLLDNDFAEEIFELSKRFNSTEEFLSEFQGLYIKTDLTDATLLYISSMRLIMYYSYTISNSNSETKYSSTRTFAASKDVGKANRIIYERTPAEFEIEINRDNTVSYVASPANVYTKVSIPIKNIVESMQDSIGLNKKLIINSAKIKVEAIIDENSGNYDENLILFPPEHLLLIEMEAREIEEYLGKAQDAFDDNVAYSAYSNACYTFDIARLLTQKINKAGTDSNGKINITDNDKLEMYLVPVSANISTTSTGNTVVSGVKHQEIMSSVKIRSGENESPMKITVIYSGF